MSKGESEKPKENKIREAIQEGRKSQIEILGIEILTLQEVRSVLASQRHPRLIGRSPETMCLEAIKELIAFKIHRMPVICPIENSILAILTHRLILRYLYDNLFSSETEFDILQMSIAELGIGTFTNLTTCTMDSPLINVLETLSSKKLSAIPIVDANGVILDIYTKADAIVLSRKKEPFSILDKPLSAFLREIRSAPTTIHTCSKNDTLDSILQRLLASRAHRVFVIDPDQKFEGVVSLLDILICFLGTTSLSH